MEGVTPEFDQQILEQPVAQAQHVEEPEAGGSVTCKTCLSECQAGWAMCPFCGNSLK